MAQKTVTETIDGQTFELLSDYTTRDNALFSGLYSDLVAALRKSKDPAHGLILKGSAVHQYAMVLYGVKTASNDSFLPSHNATQEQLVSGFDAWLELPLSFTNALITAVDAAIMPSPSADFADRAGESDAQKK